MISEQISSVFCISWRSIGGASACVCFREVMIIGGGFDLLKQMIAVVLYQLESLERVNCLCLWSEPLNMMHALQGLLPRWVSLRGPVGQFWGWLVSYWGPVGQS